LDIQHPAIRAGCGRIYFAPLKNPKHAIDIGAGTGTWIKEMATDFPECQFLGIDLNSSKLKTPLPVNCAFEEADILKGIPYPDNSFDYVHHRFLILAIPKDKWPEYIRECMRICTPGGWIEMVEFNHINRNVGPACAEFIRLLVESFLTRGLDPLISSRLDVYLREAGLENITVKEIDLPVGSWGGLAGQLFLKDFEMIFATLKQMLVHTCGITEENIDALGKACFEEIRNCQEYIKLYAYISQKPLA
jgi:SAM-dependent methyltransferase